MNMHRPRTPQVMAFGAWSRFRACMGVPDGVRTHYLQSHNLALCRMSYGHHAVGKGRALLRVKLAVAASNPVRTVAPNLANLALWFRNRTLWMWRPERRMSGLYHPKAGDASPYRPSWAHG